MIMEDNIKENRTTPENNNDTEPTLLEFHST